jgi:hypothetical protein
MKLALQQIGAAVLCLVHRGIADKAQQHCSMNARQATPTRAVAGQKAVLLAAAAPWIATTGAVLDGGLWGTCRKHWTTNAQALWEQKRTPGFCYLSTWSLRPRSLRLQSAAMAAASTGKAVQRRHVVSRSVCMHTSPVASLSVNDAR